MYKHSVSDVCSAIDPKPAHVLIKPPPPPLVACTSSPAPTVPAVPGHLWNVSSMFRVIGHKGRSWVVAHGSGGGSARASSSSLGLRLSFLCTSFAQPIPAATPAPPHPRQKGPANNRLAPNVLNTRIRVSAAMLVLSTWAT